MPHTGFIHRYHERFLPKGGKSYKEFLQTAKARSQQARQIKRLRQELGPERARSLLKRQYASHVIKLHQARKRANPVQIVGSGRSTRSTLIVSPGIRAKRNAKLKKLSFVQAVQSQMKGIRSKRAREATKAVTHYLSPPREGVSQAVAYPSTSYKRIRKALQPVSYIVSR